MSSFLVLACSGPGAAEAIGTSTLVGLGCAFVSLGLVIALIGRMVGAVRSRWLVSGAAAAVIMLALHPLWTFGAVSGDCGYTLRLAAPLVLAMHVGLVLVAWRAPRKAA